jgi:peptidoglycan/xylan/chitin deacetylase (PgdA/CDA1 family)
VKKHAKRCILAALRSCGVLHAVRCRTGSAVRILAYHGVDGSDTAVDNFDGLQVTPERFREQIEVLRKHYEVRPLDDVIAMIAGEHPLEQNTAAITFDDGYRNNLQVAAPVLKEFGMPATFFVTSGFVNGEHQAWWYQLRQALTETTKKKLEIGNWKFGLEDNQKKICALVAIEKELRGCSSEERARLMSEIMTALDVCVDTTSFPIMDRREVAELADMGFDIGPHTVSHVSLDHEDEDRITQEVVDSTAFVAEVTGKKPGVFSYPYGHSVAQLAVIKRVLQEQGFEGAVSTESGLNKVGADVYRLRRLNVGQGHDPSSFELLLSGLIR